MTDPLICEFHVEAFVKGRRIATFLARQLRTYTPWRIQRMVQAGCVMVNDVPVDNTFRVKPGERVRIRLASPPDKVAPAEDLPVTVLYEDPWLIAVSKPPGQMSHPGGDYLDGTLVNALQTHLDRQSPQRGMIRPGIVHRLDRQTSGVMVIPKDHVSHRSLTAQFTRKTVTKKYRAIVYGVVREESGEIDLPVGTVPNPDCSLMCCKPFAEQARPAQTLFRVIERFDEYTFIEAQPRTGRHHQIRIHFAEIGHPLLADEFYGPFGVLKDGTPMVVPTGIGSGARTSAQNPPVTAVSQPESAVRKATTVAVADLMASPPTDWTLSVQLAHLEPALPITRQALHAAELAIDHPITGVPVGFEAPLPADMQRTLNRLRGDCLSCTAGGHPDSTARNQEGSSQL